MLIKLTTNGTTYNITNRDLLSFKYSQDSSDNNEIIMGFASATGLNFTVRNLNGKYDSAIFNDSSCELWSDDEKIKRGFFNVKKVTRQNESLVFECVDLMTNFDKKYTESQFPKKVHEFLDELCTQCNVEHERFDILPNALVELTDQEPYIGRNCREVLQILCEFVGCFAIMNQNNKLQLKWYNFAFPSKTFTYSQLHEFSIDDRESNITGLQIYLDNLKYESGTGKYSLFLTENNPAYLEKAIDAENLLTDITDRILTRMKYYGGRIKVRADYSLNVGDVIYVYDKKGTRRTMLISNIEFNNDSNMIISSAGENRDRSFASTSKSSEGQSQSIKMVKVTNSDEVFTSADNFELLNEFVVKNISERSQVYLGYTCNFNTSSSTGLMIEVRIEGEKTNDFYYIINNEAKTVTFNLQLDLDTEKEENLVEIYLKPTSKSILVDIDNSIANLIVLNANIDTRVKNDLEINIKEEFTEIQYEPVYYGNVFLDF